MTCVVKPSDIYREKPVIPKGKKVVAFRRPKPYELFLTDIGIVHSAKDTAAWTTPRLILADCEPEVDWWE